MVIMNDEDDLNDDEKMVNINDPGLGNPDFS